MSGMGRYAIYDAYTTEELKRRYQESDTRGRIALLHELYASGTQPTREVALMAIDDPAAEIRQWLARNGKGLKYTSYFLRLDTGCTKTWSRASMTG